MWSLIFLREDCGPSLRFWRRFGACLGSRLLWLGAGWGCSWVGGVCWVNPSRGRSCCCLLEHGGLWLRLLRSWRGPFFQINIFIVSGMIIADIWQESLIYVEEILIPYGFRYVPAGDSTSHQKHTPSFKKTEKCVIFYPPLFSRKSTQISSTHRWSSSHFFTIFLP